MNDRARRQVAAWLMACAAMVAAMVVVGGVTRLTHSGLSIVEWKPLVGTIPPLSQADWTALFDKYKQTPEYTKVNLGMSLEGFQSIFWWEYFHRLLGRAIGLVFALPLVWFVIKRAISRAIALRLGGIFLLGGLQGAMGWYRVASGLVDQPRVSQYRLAAHLGLAFAILGLILWVALDLWPAKGAKPASTNLRRGALGLSVLVFVMVISGAFVAGTHAGFQFNTFPLMAGQIIPSGGFAMTPWWKNPFENVLLVQLDHRLLAYAVTAAVIAMWLRARKAAEISARARLAAHALLAALGLQVGLGIATLLLVVPVALAAAHQAGAVVLFSVAVWLARDLAPAPAEA